MLQKQLFTLAKKRGVIPAISLDRLNYKFVDKLLEEVFELVSDLHETRKINPVELADCLVVICNCAEANGIDIEQVALEKATNDLTRKPKQCC